MSCTSLARAACMVGAAAALLVACASPGPAPGLQSGDGTAPTTVSGRLVVKVDDPASDAALQDGAPMSSARSLSANFELRAADQRGDLRLYSPLGTQLALATWDTASGATLTTSQGTRNYADLNALAVDTLGVALPLSALQYWLSGRPWPGAPVQPRAEPAGFDQLGWHIDLARYAADALIVASRAEPTAVTVRARIDRP